MTRLSGPTMRTFSVALKAIVLFTVCVVAYTALVTGVSQALFSDKANGSLLRSADGTVVGSSLLGQSYTDEEGKALPGYLQSRPSAAGEMGYDARSSSGTNYGPENPDFIASVKELKQQIAEREGVSPEDVPADAVTSSSSGLDPHISPEYAEIQVARIARERHIDESTVKGIIHRYTSDSDLEYLGEPTVNVVQVNLALDQL